MKPSIDYVRSIITRGGESVPPEAEAILSKFVAEPKIKESCGHLRRWEEVVVEEWRCELRRLPGDRQMECPQTGRAIPVYLLLDTSGSMWGERIAAVNNGLQTMVARLKRDGQMNDSVYISIITFDGQVNQILPLTLLRDLELPEIVCPRASPTNMGAALMMLLRKSKEDRFGHDEWRPMVYLMTDGGPSDLMVFREAVEELRGEHFSRIVACAVGTQAKDGFLREITDTVLHLDTVDSATLAGFIEYIGDSIALPPPPKELHVVL